jgi:FkbM family methyltransferase
MDVSFRYCTFGALRFNFNEIFINQTYHFVTANPKPFIVDCGSNIGLSVLYFKMLYPNAEVLAFEPDSDAFACLERNVNASGFQGVTAKQEALSATKQAIELFYDPDKPGALTMSTIRERMPKASRLVKAVPLSTYIDRPVDFLKIDVEGAERDVLEDLRVQEKLHYVSEMAIEYHNPIRFGTNSLSSLLGLLEDGGFSYQCEARLRRPLKPNRVQNILIHAYRKD